MEFKLHWLDGKTEKAEGDSIADAFMKAGYSAGAIKALDYYEEIKSGDMEKEEQS